MERDDEEDLLVGAFNSSLALAPALDAATRQLTHGAQEIRSWDARPCFDDAHAEATLVALVTAQREILAWADPVRRRAIEAWLAGPIRTRAAALEWQLRKFLWPQCAACTVGGCARHTAELRAQLPPLPAQMRRVSSDEVGVAIRFWHGRSCAALDYAGCVEAVAVLASADDWAMPLRTDEHAASIARLAARETSTVEQLGCHLHNRLFPACTSPWAQCVLHRARWQCPAPAPVPALPDEADVDGEAGGLLAGLALGGATHSLGASAQRTPIERARAARNAPPAAPPPPLHGVQ